MGESIADKVKRLKAEKEASEKKESKDNANDILQEIREEKKKKSDQPKRKKEPKGPSVSNKKILDEIIDLKSIIKQVISFSSSDPVLVEMGRKHVLSEANLIQYFKEVQQGKLYELKRYFHENSSLEISELLTKLLNNKSLIKRKNGWISFNSSK